MNKYDINLVKDGIYPILWLISDKILEFLQNTTDL